MGASNGREGTTRTWASKLPFSIVSVTPAKRAFPRETVPSRHRQRVVQKDGCLQWNVWEQLMERMGASSGTYGSSLWKGWVHLMEKMGASNGHQWPDRAAASAPFTWKPQ